MPYSVIREADQSIATPPAHVLSDTLEELGAGLRHFGWRPIYFAGPSLPERGRTPIGIAVEVRGDHDPRFRGVIYAYAEGSIHADIRPGIRPPGHKDGAPPLPFPGPFVPGEYAQREED